MGTKEDSTTKPSKLSTSTQEVPVPTVPPSYPDWSNSMQVLEHMIDFYHKLFQISSFPNSLASAYVTS